MVMGLSLASCSDWLDINPSDEIKEEYLFSSGQGYQTALNGIYRQMASFDLYGSNLSWGIIDAWGQEYSLYVAHDGGGGKAMKKISSLEFTDSELTPTTDGMWSAAWNAIANCNELIQQAETAAADTTIFYLGDFERKLILNEAIALRAMIHFDLLRIYAPAPVTNPGDKTFIPYIDYYPAYLSDNKTVSQCMEKIINDLKTAQEALYLLEGKRDVSNDPNSRFNRPGAGNKLFFSLRGFRMNYFAVTALLARVYLYAGMKAEAYEQAKALIDIESRKGYYKAVTSSYFGPKNIEAGNIKMYENIIFGLYSKKELVDWDAEINHGSDGNDEYNQSYLCWEDFMIDNYFGDEKEEDWRCLYQFESKQDGYYFRPLKYNKQQESSQYGPVNNTLIPMIRMSEVYYIAAEAIFDPADANKMNEAKNYLTIVKQGRGIRRPNLSEINTTEEFMDALINDARREFVGEGQTFFIYKRLNKIIPTAKYGGDDILPSNENFVLPKPASESNIK